MSDVFYRVVRFVGNGILLTCSSPLVVGRDRVPACGPCIVASTHQSPYDVPLLIRHTPRLLDFVSIVEVFSRPLVGWFYGSLNAFPLDRARADSKTVRIILERLQQERAVAMFPEGAIRDGNDSVVHSRRIKGGIGRISLLAGSPVVPCVVLGSQAYRRFWSWLPLRRTRYGVIYGEPLAPDPDPERLEQRLIEAFVTLHRVLREDMGLSTNAVPGFPSAGPPTSPSRAPH
jgi:1-acyl-sn-glycerol-3-phosphate acyltransferase